MRRSSYKSDLEKNMPSCRQRRGFTLIELLVVVAIIALLISILLPSLKRARDQAKDTLCLTRLKSIGTALETYQGEWNGYVPPHSDPDAVWHWRLLEGYMAGQRDTVYEDFLCPSDMTRTIDGFFNDKSVSELEREQRWAFDISYGLSHVTYQDYGTLDNMTTGVVEYHPEGHIKHPGRTILVTDSGDRELRHNVYLKLLPATLWNLLHRNYEGYVVDDDHRYPAKRHRGGSNVLFQDKHAEWASYNTLIPPPTANGEKQVCPWWYRNHDHQELMSPYAHRGGYE